MVGRGGGVGEGAKRTGLAAASGRTARRGVRLASGLTVGSTGRVARGAAVANGVAVGGTAAGRGLGGGVS
jgi:hypothetical protein